MVFFVIIVMLLASICMISTTQNEPRGTGLGFRIVQEAKKHLGLPYVYGGTSLVDGCDCSGFVCTMSRDSIGVPLPRTSRAIFNKMTVIEKENLEPGDLVFFKTTSTGSISHVGIFIGENKFIHAASDGPETGVIITSLNERFWKNTYFASGRYLASAKIPSVDDVEKDSENVD